MEQGSQEWFAIRCRKVTASRISDLTAKTKSGWGAGRANYMAQLIAERLTGEVAESFSNGAMQWGNDNEAEARSAYQFRKGVEVSEVAFVVHPSIPLSGAIPDGLVDDDGLVEIKCPNTATHIDTLLKQSVPTKYIKQIQWQLACAEREWCDFVSFDPRMPEAMRLFVHRIERDTRLILDLQDHVTTFLIELDRKLADLKTAMLPPETREAVDILRAG